MAETTYTYRITAEGVDAVKAAFSDLQGKLLEFAGIGGLGLMIDNSLKTASGIETMSKQAAMSTTDFQEWTYALQQFNVSQETAATGMRMLAQNAAQFVTQNSGQAKNAFGILGMSQQDVQQAMKDESSFFALVLQKIGEVKNSAEQLDLAKMLFGRQSGAEFIEPIQAGITALQQYRQEAEQLGIVFDQSTIEGARKAEVEIGNLETILHDKLAIAIDENADKIAHMAQVGIDMLPTLIALIDDMATGLEENAKWLEEIGNGDFSSVFSHISQGLTASMSNTVMPRAVNPTGMSTGYQVNNPSQANGYSDLTNMAFSGSTPQAGQLPQDFYSMMGLTAPPAAGGSVGGSVPDIGDPAAAKAAEKMAEANQKVIQSLQDEVTAMSESDRQLAIVTAERKLNKDATDDQRQAVADLAGEYYDEKQRMQEVKTASTDIMNAFDDMTFKGQKFGDVLKNLAVQLLQLTEKSLLGNNMQNGLTSIMNSVFGMAGASSGGRAGGGDVSAGSLYNVNEDGQEYFQPSVDGRVIPLGGSSGMSVTVNNYANANVAAVQNGNGLEIRVTNLEEGLQQVSNSIPIQAASAVQQMYSRSTTFLRT